MQVPQEMVFLSEIVQQVRIAQRANERLKANHNTSDHVEVWCSIQSILGAAGIVSKILWPIRKQSMSRGKHLRKLLKVDDNNLLSNRKFRDHFEHYDERIEEWFNKQPRGSYIDLAMNPSLIPVSAHRGYNSFDNTLLFRGELLDLSEVLKALEDILDNCRPYVLIKT